MVEEQGASGKPDRATAVEPVPVSPLRDGIPSAKARIPWTLGATDYTYGVQIWIARMEGLAAHFRIIRDQLPEDAVWLRNQVNAGLAEVQRYLDDPAPEPPGPLRHAFEPDTKYPWFCGQCGYPPHETLKHIPANFITETDARYDIA